MSIVSWLLDHLNCRECSSAEFMYDEMDSQSGRSLPVIYREFDLGNRTHWRDEGQILDFFCSLAHESPRVLDFGPGDGWPSLRLAPMAAEVVGVDASACRIEECRTNALDLGVANARFMHSAAGVFSSPHATGRPTNHAAVRDYLLPIVDAAVRLEAPIADDPWITAVA